MKKYLTIAKAEWLDAIQSYQEVILWIIIQSLPILVMGVLWSSSGASLSAAKISYLVSYYIVIFLVDRLTSFYFEKNLQDEIREGTFSRYLLKPVMVQKYLIWAGLGGKLFNSIFLLFPIMLIISTVFSGYLVIPNLLYLCLFVVSLISAFFIQFSMSILVTSVAFFIEQAFAFNHLHWMLDAVAGGYMLPLTFYPKILGNFFGFLPFACVYFVPVNIFTGQFPVEIASQKIGVSVFWAITLYIFSNFVWRTGIKRYSSVGG